MVSLLILVGCVEYGLHEGKDQAGLPVDSAWSDSAPVDDSVDTAAYPEDPHNEPPLPCASVDLDWRWEATAPFTGAADPTDNGGLPWWDPRANPSTAPVTLPHVDIPVGSDRAYRATFSLDALPAALQLSLQSDDGLWLWVNGVEVGHWGGDYQQEGCVNDNARCVQTVEVPELDITPWLQPGENLIAARVSNPVMNAWFEILPRCED